MIVLGLLGPISFVAMPMLIVMVGMIFYIVFYHCNSVPLSRQSRQEDATSGRMMMKMVSCEDVAEELDKREGNQTAK